MLFVLLHRGALKEDLDGSVIIPAAQWIALCNVAKPFSSLLTGPSPQHPSSARPLSSSRRHTPLSLPLRLLYSRITQSMSGADGRVRRGQRSSQMAPLTGVYLRPATLTAAKSTSIRSSRRLGFCTYSPKGVHFCRRNPCVSVREFADIRRVMT